jgi:uncharacterized protein HemY
VPLAAFGRFLFLFGLAVAAIGLALWVGGHLGLGRLPGDIRIQRGGFTLYAPLATGLLLSLVLTLLLNLLARR